MPALATDILTLTRAKAELGIQPSNTRHDALVMLKIPEAVAAVEALLPWPLVDAKLTYTLRIPSSGPALFNTAGDVKQITNLTFTPAGGDETENLAIAAQDNFTIPRNGSAAYVAPGFIGQTSWPAYDPGFPVLIEALLSRDRIGVSERLVAACVTALLAVYHGDPVDLEALEALI